MGELKLLALSDIHGKEDIVRFFVKDVARRKLEFDYVVVAGDIGNPQKPWIFKSILDELCKLGKPVLYVRGNWDVNIPEKVGSAIDLEREGPIVDGEFVLIGHGRYTRPYPVDSGLIKVLVTHYPPYSIMDKGKKLDAPYQTQHSGLIPINYLVERYSPAVHIFGHSHSFGGIDLEFRGVTYVNVARLDRMTRNGQYIGNYGVITVESSGKVRVDWYFLNGVWRTCNSCGRRVHLPASWSVCRKCANKRELKFEPNAQLSPNVFVRVNVVEEGLNSRVLLEKELTLPVSTIANTEAYSDFLDLVIVRCIVEKLREVHARVLDIPKDKVIEFYGLEHDDAIIPFSEYLFSNDEKLMGRRLYSIMRFYAHEKRVHILWGFNEDGSGMPRRLAAEYIVVDAGVLKRCREHYVRLLINNGFTILVVDKDYRRVVKVLGENAKSMQRRKQLPG